MKENGIAITLKVIGWVILVCAFIVAVSSEVEEIFGISFGWTIMVSAFITCMMFQGFGEVVALLQQNSNKQSEILDYLKDQAAKGPSAPKTVIEDIESNLPNL